MAVRAGTLDRRCSIDYKSVELDASYGTEIVTWLRLTQVWANVEDVLPSRSESVRQGLEVARNQVRVRMRYRDDITSEMRIIVHGRNGDVVYQIVGGPAMMGRQEMLEMVCEKFTS